MEKKIFTSQDMIKFAGMWSNYSIDDDHLQNYLERVEQREKENKKICPDCEGSEDIVSDCCGASIDSDMLICYECKEHSDIAVCETCDGEGVID
jgi:hypothetical protein